MTTYCFCTTNINKYLDSNCSSVTNSAYLVLHWHSILLVWASGLLQNSIFVDYSKLVKVCMKGLILFALKKIQSLPLRNPEFIKDITVHNLPSGCLIFLLLRFLSCCSKTYSKALGYVKKYTTVSSYS